MGVSYELELDEDRVRRWVLEHRSHWQSSQSFFNGFVEEMKLEIATFQEVLLW